MINKEYRDYKYFSSIFPTISLNELKFLHDYINDSYSKKHIKPALSCILSAHTGIPPKEWYHILSNSHKNIKLKQYKNQFAYSYGKRSNKVIIILPLPISYLIKKNINNIKMGVTLKHFYEFLNNNFVNIDVINTTYLKNFFKAYYIGRYTLDQITAYYISYSFSSYTDAPAAYIKLSLKQVNETYLKAFKKLWEDLYENK